jgi:hypothetical protein
VRPAGFVAAVTASSALAKRPVIAGPSVAAAFSGMPAANMAAMYNGNENKDARRVAEVEFKISMFSA